MRKLSRPKYSRVRTLLALIREGTRRGQFPSATILARELGVSTRTILRDLDGLRDDDNAPIEYDASCKGFRLTDEMWELPSVSVSTKEIFAFSIAQKLIEAFRGTPLEMDMKSVFSKIAESMEGKVTIDPAAMTDRLTIVAEDYVRQDPDIWAAVAKLLDRMEQIHMTYQKFNGETKEYLLDPYHLCVYHGNWYVLGRRVGVGVERLATFAVSRIRKIEGTGQYFEIPESFDPQEHIRQSFGIVRGDKVFKVKLLFAKKIATYIKEREWHPTQKIVNKRDGSIELSFETAGWKELVRWILSWQPDVKVIAPTRLRERIELKMRQALGEK